MAVSGLSATGTIGTVFVKLGIVERVTGVYGQTQLGTVVAKANADVVVAGVQTTGFVGGVNVWGEIDDNQDPNWQNISGTQTPSWGNVSREQTPDWEAIAA